MNEKQNTETQRKKERKTNKQQTLVLAIDLWLKRNNILKIDLQRTIVPKKFQADLNLFSPNNIVIFKINKKMCVFFFN